MTALDTAIEPMAISSINEKLLSNHMMIMQGSAVNRTITANRVLKPCGSMHHFCTRQNICQVILYSQWKQEAGSKRPTCILPMVLCAFAFMEEANKRAEPCSSHSYLACSGADEAG